MSPDDFYRHLYSLFCMLRVEYEEQLEFHAFIDGIEKFLIMRTLERFPENNSKAARFLNVKRTTLLEMRKRYKLPLQPSCGDPWKRHRENQIDRDNPRGNLEVNDGRKKFPKVP